MQVLPADQADQPVPEILPGQQHENKEHDDDPGGGERAEQRLGDGADDHQSRGSAEFAARPEVHAVAVSHRVGLLGIGDVALACAVSTSHRGQAFAACAELVDEVKARLPIWKRQVFGDGDEEWVACP